MLCSHNILYHFLPTLINYRWSRQTKFLSTDYVFQTLTKVISFAPLNNQCSSYLRLTMSTYKSVVRSILTITIFLMPMCHAHPNSTIQDYGSPRYPDLNISKSKDLRTFYDRAEHRFLRTSITCYKLGNVLLRPARYAPLLHFVQWNGFVQDHACCAQYSQDTLYCSEADKASDMARLKWQWFKRLCARGRRPLSYTVVQWGGSGINDACMLVRTRDTSLKHVSNRKLHGSDREPKAAVLNFRNTSASSMHLKIQALRRWLKLQSPPGFHSIYENERRLFSRTNRFRPGQVYTFVFTFDPQYIAEFWTWPWQHSFATNNGNIKIFRCTLAFVPVIICFYMSDRVIESW